MVRGWRKGWAREEGEAKMREKSTKMVFSGYISVCPGVRNSRGPPVMGHIWVWGRGRFVTEEAMAPRMAGAQNDGSKPRLLTMQQGLCATLDGPGHDAPQQTRHPALAELCLSGVSWGWLSESSCSVLIPLTQACLISNHSSVWQGGGGFGGGGEVRALHPLSLVLCSRLHWAPEPSCVCPKKPLPLDNKWSWIFLPCSRKSITYIMHCLHSLAVDMPEAKAFWMLPVMDEMRPYPRYKSNWHPMNPFKVVCVGNGQTSLFVGPNISYGKNSEGEAATQLFAAVKTFPKLLPWAPESLRMAALWRWGSLKGHQEVCLCIFMAQIWLYWAFNGEVQVWNQDSL